MNVLPTDGSRIRSSSGRASRTAELMAVQRGLESVRPPRARLFADPLARSFVSLPWRATLAGCHLGAVRAAVEAAYDFAGGPGPRASAVARTKLIDDLVDEIAPRVEQVVLLGAGFDTRPYRLPGFAVKRVFEVDQPYTQAAKRGGLARAKAGTGHVVFVPVDFEADDLSIALTDAGYAIDRPALFVWEGVTQYLSADAVDNTLAVVHELAGAEGRLVFTYVDQAVIDSQVQGSPELSVVEFPEASKWLQGVNKRGEPWIFGVPPARTSDFLSLRGFELIEDVSTADAGARYFKALGRREQGSGLYRVAVARIGPNRSTAAP
ncbi:MAG TPA: SAM-dependent methyltransferase [Acidimicrobiales bacterium]|nr:SAM-dependent methyltransferase [Acidimicrobiales bacterium]